MLKCYKESKENVEDLKGMLHEVYLCIRFKYIPTLVPFVRVVRPFKPQISFGRAESSRVVPCVGAWAHVAVPKMLSRDRPCAFFVRVMHPWKPQISLGRFGSARPGWVGSCRAVCG